MTGDTGIGDDRYERLTERQRECLRLVASGLQMKEIARRLAVKPDAVRERLRAAREALGVDRSLGAARLFVEWEAKAGPGTAPAPDASLHVAYTRDVEPQKSFAPPHEPPPDDDMASRPFGDRERGRHPVMQERQAAFHYDRPLPEQTSRSLRDGLIGRRPNDRDIGQRLTLIILLAIAMAILFWGGAAVFIYLSRALIDIARHGG